MVLVLIRMVLARRFSTLLICSTDPLCHVYLWHTFILLHIFINTERQKKRPQCTSLHSGLFILPLLRFQPFIAQNITGICLQHTLNNLQNFPCIKKIVSDYHKTVNEVLMCDCQKTVEFDIDETVSIGPSLCSVTEWSVCVAGMECWFS